MLLDLALRSKSSENRVVNGKEIVGKECALRRTEACALVEQKKSSSRRSCRADEIAERIENLGI